MRQQPRQYHMPTFGYERRQFRRELGQRARENVGKDQIIRRSGLDGPIGCAPGLIRLESVRDMVLVRVFVRDEYTLRVDFSPYRAHRTGFDASDRQHAGAGPDI